MGLQAQEVMTALHNACQQLEGTATGRAAEARLQKALAKLHKVQQTPTEAAAVTGAGSQPVAGPAKSAEAAAVTGQKATASLPQAAGPAQKAAAPGQKAAGPVALAASEAIAEGTLSQGLPAAAVPGSSQPTGERSSSCADVEMTAVEEGESGAAQASAAPLHLRATAQQEPGAASQADKETALAEKKAQKEEAKVGVCHFHCGERTCGSVHEVICACCLHSAPPSCMCLLLMML